MKYKKGDRVRIVNIDKFLPARIMKIDDLTTNRIVTIKKVLYDDESYLTKELDRWRWSEKHLELVVENNNDGPIEDRFQILDIRTKVKEVITRKKIERWEPKLIDGYNRPVIKKMAESISDIIDYIEDYMTDDISEIIECLTKNIEKKIEKKVKEMVLPGAFKYEYENREKKELRDASEARFGVDNPPPFGAGQDPLPPTPPDVEDIPENSLNNDDDDYWETHF